MDEILINYLTLGKHIKAARKAKHITHEMLAEKMDVSVGHVGKIEPVSYTHLDVYKRQGQAGRAWSG